MIEISDLKFQYPQSDFQLVIDELKIPSGQTVAVIGPSGSGKTTLLNLISGIIETVNGSVIVDGTIVSSLNDSGRRNFRAANIGFVFQQFELIEYLSMRENILLPYMINKSLRQDKTTIERADQLAESMGLDGKLNRKIGKLSQGEQQRVAVCRALVTKPSLLLADEPTGNLDPKNKEVILRLLLEYCRLEQATMLVVTHDMAIVGGFDRQIDFALFHQDASSDPLPEPASQQQEAAG